MPPRGTRPTTDRVRESLFNVLAARMDLDGASVLDLYAGSGALGLEALSRGAAAAVFVESDQRAAAVIGQNIKTLGVAGATLRRGTVASVLAAGADQPRRPGARRPALRRRRRRDRRDAERADDARMGGRRHRRGGGAGRVGPAAAVAAGVGEVWPQRKYGDTRLDVASG